MIQSIKKRDFEMTEIMRPANKDIKSHYKYFLYIAEDKEKRGC